MTHQNETRDELLAEVLELRRRVAQLESEPRAPHVVEESRRERQDQFRMLADLLPQLVWTCLPDGRCDFVSRQWVEYTGMPESQHLGYGWYQQLHPQDRRRTLDTWMESVRTSADFDIEFRIRRHDGTYRWFKTRALPLRNWRGQVTKWFGTNTDISELKQQELQLRILSDMGQAVIVAATLDDTLQSILETITTGLGWEWSAIWDVDEQANVLRCSAIWHGSSLRVKEFEALTRRITFPSGVGLPGRVWASGDPTTVPDVCQDTSLPRAPAAAKEGLHGAFAFPILLGNKIIGIMELLSTQVRVADSHELALLANISGYVGQQLDRKRAEEALRLSEQHLLAIIEASPECIKLVASDGTLLQMNAAGLQMIEAGRSEDIVGQSVYTLIAPQHREAFKAFNERVCAGHKGQLEFEIVGLQGTRCLMETHAVPLQLPGEGRLVGLALTRNITGRQRAETALRESQGRFRQLAETIREVFWLTNADKTEMLYISPGYEQVWQRTCDSLYASPGSWLDAIHPDDKLGIKQATGDYDLEYRILRPDGSVRWIRDRAFPIRDQSGTVYRIAGVAEDITERKHLENQFRQSQKMEAVGLLAGGIAHDYNNTLTVIMGYCEMLLSRLPRGSVESEQIEEIQKAGVRASTMTRQLLAFSRCQIMLPKVVNLNTVTGDVERLLYRLIGENIQLSIVLQPDLWLVKADPAQLEQMLMNLAINARDAMPRGGRLTVETANVDLDDAFVQSHQGARPGAFVSLLIRDTGHGMDAATLARIFEPFFTTKPLGKGTGLGLSLVYGIVKQSDGLIYAESRPGKGTTFTIYLPRTTEPQATPAREAAQPSKPAGRENILLVEDDDAVRSVTAIFLRQLGYQVLEAKSPHDALQVGARHEGFIHLLVTDVILPQINGAEVAARLKALRPEVKVLYMSGYSPDTLREHGLGLSDVALLRKPFTSEALGEAVRNLLEVSVGGCLGHQEF